MIKVLILTGACGVGKSTISKTWATKKRGVAIESDYFTEWVFNNKYEQFLKEEEEMVADLTFVVAKEYLKHGMPVAIDNVWSPIGLEKLKNRFEKEIHNILLKFVWLKCNRIENHRRDGLRIPDNQMKERVDIVNRELNNYDWPNYVDIIDSSNITVRETIYEIEKLNYIRYI